MAGKIAIDPRGEIQWKHATACVGDAPGQLFISPNCPIDDPERMINNYYFGQPGYAYIDYGAHGSVHKTPDGHALKDFTIGGDLSFLRANVLLAEGLKRVPEATRYRYSVRGLEIHAAFKPGEVSKRSLGDKCFWLMEFIDEKPDNDIDDIPSYDTQRFLYIEALKSYGVPEGVTSFDCGLGEGSLHNLLVEDVDDGQVKYVKIDISPFGDFYKNY